MRGEYGLQACLTEDHVYFGGMSISYRLLLEGSGCARVFRICVELGKEAATEELGNDLWHAGELYRRIVRGSVTPCALEEVVRELKYA